jgi:hypothetical protein
MTLGRTGGSTLLSSAGADVHVGGFRGWMCLNCKNRQDYFHRCECGTSIDIDRVKNARFLKEFHPMHLIGYAIIGLILLFLFSAVWSAMHPSSY